MDPILELDQPELQVEPGAEARTRLSVRNDGPDEERYRLEILGDAARWAHVEPRHVAAPPGGPAQHVDVVFRPPPVTGATASARTVRFGVRCLSLENRDDAAVVEGDLLVSPVRDLSARLEPEHPLGRWTGTYRVVLGNRGIHPIPLRLSGVDPHLALSYALAPRDLTVAPRGSAEVLLAVRPRRPVLAGAPVKHSFTCEYRASDGSSVGRLPGVFEQRAVLPVPVVAVGGLLLLLLVVAGVLLALGPIGAPAPEAGPGSASAPPSAGPTAVAPVPVQGFLVIYGAPTPIDDAVNAGTAQAFVAELTAAGVQARLVDSRQSDQIDDGIRGLWVVLRDGFPDRASAQAECDAHRDIAPDCRVVAPR